MSLFHLWYFSDEYVIANFFKNYFHISYLLFYFTILSYFHPLFSFFYGVYFYIWLIYAYLVSMSLDMLLSIDYERLYNSL